MSGWRAFKASVLRVVCSHSVSVFRVCWSRYSSNFQVTYTSFNFFVFLFFSCSGWSAPCPSNQLCAARVWTTFSSAATANPASPQPSSLHLHPLHPLPPSQSPPWPTSAVPHIRRLSVPTPHCHHTHLLSVPRCPKASQSLRLNQSRLTVSRSTSSVGPPAASNVNT